MRRIISFGWFRAAANRFSLREMIAAGRYRLSLPGISARERCTDGAFTGDALRLTGDRGGAEEVTGQAMALAAHTLPGEINADPRETAAGLLLDAGDARGAVGWYEAMLADWRVRRPTALSGLEIGYARALALAQRPQEADAALRRAWATIEQSGRLVRMRKIRHQQVLGLLFLTTAQAPAAMPVLQSAWPIPETNAFLRMTAVEAFPVLAIALMRCGNTVAADWVLQKGSQKRSALACTR